MYLRDGEIIKVYAYKEPFEREARMLEILLNAGLRVPILLAKDESALTLKMEYIPGNLYVDLVDGMTVDRARALARWIVEFHRITGFPKGDVNLRNFLWTGKACAGLDFEDPPQKGKPETDMGKIIAYAATYRPPFTPGKVKSCSLLLDAFLDLGGLSDRIKKAYGIEITAMNCRRKGSYIEMKDAFAFWEHLIRYNSAVQHI